MATRPIRTASEVPPVRLRHRVRRHGIGNAPPYTTLTAYDLNTGTIKWQVPLGDDLATLARGGPANTGGLGARNGMVTTKGGLVFVAGRDGKLRAYDEDNGTDVVDGNAAWLVERHSGQLRSRRAVNTSSWRRSRAAAEWAAGRRPCRPTRHGDTLRSRYRDRNPQTSFQGEIFSSLVSLSHHRSRRCFLGVTPCSSPTAFPHSCGNGDKRHGHSGKREEEIDSRRIHFIARQGRQEITRPNASDSTHEHQQENKR